MGSNEIDTWLGLLKAGPNKMADKGLVDSFANLENSIFYLASLDESPIGGTALYLDKYRLGMALVNVVIDPQYIDETAYAVIKSSLPYFRSVAIRDIDALVGVGEALAEIPFPLSLEVMPWTSETLTKMGFKRVASIHHIRVGEVNHKRESKGDADYTADLEGLKKLYWEIYKEEGLNCSQFWCAFDISASRGRMVTANSNNQVVMGFGVDTVGTHTIISPILTKRDLVTPEMVAHEIAQRIGPEITMIDLPLVGAGQLDFLMETAQHIGKITGHHELSLMRKTL